jgi:hypothetical protein
MDIAATIIFTCFAFLVGYFLGASNEDFGVATVFVAVFIIFVCTVYLFVCLARG